MSKRRKTKFDKVNIYCEGDPWFVPAVNINRDLDVYDPKYKIWYYLKVGAHLGITRLQKEYKGMSFVSIYSFDSKKEPVAYLISEKEAKRLVNEADRQDLYKKFFPRYTDRTRENWKKFKAVRVDVKHHDMLMSLKYQTGRSMTALIEEAIDEKYRKEFDI